VSLTKNLLIAVAAGAAGKYFLDPSQGAQRRAKVKEKANEYIASLPSMDSLMGHLEGKGQSEGAPATKSALGTLFASGAGSLLLSRMLGRRAGLVGMAPVVYQLWKQARAAKASHNKPLEPMNEPPLPHSRNFE
jgi:hypothetical protein